MLTSLVTEIIPSADIPFFFMSLSSILSAESVHSHFIPHKDSFIFIAEST